MSKYGEAYEDKDLPAIVIEKPDIDIKLAKLTNRDKKKIKEKTGVDLMQKFMEMQSAGGGAQINPAVEKIFASVDKSVKDQIDLNKIKTQLSNIVSDEDENPMQKIFADIDITIEHLLFKHSLEHDDPEIEDEIVDKIIADLALLEKVRALMWLIMGRDMEEAEAEEIADEADQGNLSIPSKTGK